MDFNIQPALSLTLNYQQKPHKTPEQANQVPQMLPQDSDTTVSKQPLGLDQHSTSEKLINPTTTLVPIQGGHLLNRFEKILQGLNKNQHPQDTPKMGTDPKQLSNKSTVQKDIGLKRQTEQNRIDSVAFSSVPITPQLTEGDNGETLDSTSNARNAPTTTLVPIQGGHLLNRFEKILQGRNKNQHPQDTPKMGTDPKQLSNKSTMQKDIGLKRQTEQNQIDSVAFSSVPTTPQLRKKKILESDNSETLDSTSNARNAPNTTLVPIQGGHLLNRFEKILQGRNKNQHPQDTPKMGTDPKQLSNKSTMQKDIGLKRQTEQNQIDSVAFSSVPTTPQLRKKKILESDNSETLDSTSNARNAPNTTLVPIQGGPLRNRFEKILQGRNKNQHPQDTPKMGTDPKQLSNKSTVQKDIGLKRQTEQNRIDSVASTSIPITPQLRKKKILESDNGKTLESIINVGNVPPTKLKHKSARKIQQQDSFNQVKENAQHALPDADIHDETTVSLLARETNSKLSLEEKRQVQNLLPMIAKSHIAEAEKASNPSIPNINPEIGPTLIAYKCLLCEYMTDHIENMKSHILRHHKNHNLKCALPDHKPFKYTTAHTVIAGNDLIQAKKQQEELKMKKSLEYQKNKDNAQYVCDIHEMTFPNKYAHDIHMNTHKSTYSFCCLICRWLTKDWITLQKHYRKEHKFTTEYLNSKIAINGEQLTIKEHSQAKCEELKNSAAQTNKSLEQRTFICEYNGCGKKCDTNAQLRAHLRRHAGNRFKCGLCYIELGNEKQLREHLEICIFNKSPKITKPYVCQFKQCTVATNTYSGITEHMLFSVAHSEPNFKCLFCNTSFQTQHSLERHLKFKRCPKPEKRPFACSNCEKRYTYETNKDKHQKLCLAGNLQVSALNEEQKTDVRQMIKEINVAIENSQFMGVDFLEPYMVVIVPSVKSHLKAIMFTSAPTPLHHIRQLLYKMLSPHYFTCTSLYKHFFELNDRFDIANIRIVAFADSAPTVRIIKKIMVKLGRQYNALTNLTEFAPYHIYSDGAISKIAQIIQENLQIPVEANIEADLKKCIVTACIDGPRGDWELVYNKDADFFSSNKKLHLTIHATLTDQEDIEQKMNEKMEYEELREDEFYMQYFDDTM